MSNASDFIIENGVLKKYVGPGGDVVIPEGVCSIGMRVFMRRTDIRENITSIRLPISVTSVDDSAFTRCDGLKFFEALNPYIKISMLAFGYGRTESRTQIYLPDVCYIPNVSLWKCSTGMQKLFFTACYYTCPERHSETEKAQYEEYAKTNKEKLFSVIIQNGNQNAMKNFLTIALNKATASELIGKNVEIAIEDSSLIALLCEEGLISAKYIDAYLTAAQQSGDVELIAMLLDYQNNKLTAKEKEKAEKQKQKQEGTVFDRALARMNREGISGLNFVATGRLETFKDEMQLKAFIERKSGKLRTAISSKTDYLIMNDINTNDKKKKRAEELGIEIITERQFNEMAGRLFLIKKGVLEEYCGAGGNIVIPDSVTSIGDGAFKWCSSLTDVVIPDSVTSIGYRAFSGCRGLADQDGFVIVRGVLYNYYGSQKDIIIPDSVTSIGDMAFKDCSSLTSVVIPDSVTSIGNGAFKGCRLTIYAPAGSYAETYAKRENNIRFVAV